MVWTVTVQGLSASTIYASAALACAAAGAIAEVRSRRIPNFISTSGIVAGLLLHLAFGNWPSVAGAAMAAALAAGISLPFYLAGAMDAGDVKLMVAVCCLAGPMGMPQVLVGAALGGGLAVLFVALFRWRAKSTHSNAGRLLADRIGAANKLHLHGSRELAWPFALALTAGAASSVCNLLVR